MSLPFPISSGSPASQIDPKQLELLDAPLIALTQQCGGDLRRLLFAFFSFLHRRTDFYLVPHPDDIQEGKPVKMGFKEGDAEKVLLAAFRQFPLRRIPREAAGGETATTTSAKTPAGATSTKTSEGKNALNSNEESENENEVSISKPSSKVSGKAKNIDEIGNMAGVEYTEEGLQKPVGNGGSTAQYKWTQTLDECSVLIGIPETLKGKDLSVSITATSISIKSKKPLEGDETQRTFLEGNLVAKIRPEESIWSLEGGVLVLTLDKLRKTFWETILEGDEKIDTSLVDSRRHISDYDEATQAQIRKIVLDQNQASRGLPASGEISGAKKVIPSLPDGVEYIDKKTLDDYEKKTKSSTEE